MITIVDYGLGNIGAFANVYKRMNIPTTMARTGADLERAERIILPGVGAFDHAMNLLNSSGMRPSLEYQVQTRKVPTMGVCVGMQILADSSDEGACSGLGWIPGHVRRFSIDAGAGKLPIPHMGWNDVRPSNNQPLFEGLDDGARFYFLHSYLFDCEDPSHSAATTEYGATFSSAVRNQNVFGVQFHPEKSHHFGATLLRNFGMLTC